jgi:hypothetical protein
MFRIASLTQLVHRQSLKGYHNSLLEQEGGSWYCEEQQQHVPQTKSVPPA